MPLVAEIVKPEITTSVEAPVIWVHAVEEELKDETEDKVVEATAASFVVPTVGPETPIFAMASKMAEESVDRSLERLEIDA